MLCVHIFTILSDFVALITAGSNFIKMILGKYIATWKIFVILVHNAIKNLKFAHYLWQFIDIIPLNAYN